MSAAPNMSAVVTSHQRTVGPQAPASSVTSTGSSDTSAANLTSSSASASSSSPGIANSSTSSTTTTTTTATPAQTPTASGPTLGRKLSPSTVAATSPSPVPQPSSTASADSGVASAPASKQSAPQIAAPATTNGSMSDSVTSTDGQRTPSNPEHFSKTNLYFKGLTPNTRDHDLEKMCSRFGHISSIKAIIEKSSGCCKGYGFVEFTSPQAAEMAVQELSKGGVQVQMARIPSNHLPHGNLNHHGYNQHHHSQNHRHQQHHNNGNHSHHTNYNNNHHSHNANPSNMGNPDPTNLYIANLPPNMSEQELENLLSAFGSVVSTRILRDLSTNIPRGVGFARMESKDKCEQIIEQLNGQPYKGWKEPLLVKFADGGNKKRHQQQQHQHHHQHHNNHQSGNHQQHHKVHQNVRGWRDGSGTSGDMNNTPSYDHHQGYIPHSNHLSDLAMMGTMSYPRLQPGYQAPIAHGGPYAGPMGPTSSATQWVPAGAPGQSYVIPQQMIQAGGLAPSNQAAAAAALHYGRIPQLTSQMQSLSIAHPGAPIGGYHMAQWSSPWAAIPQQNQPSIRLTSPMQPSPPSQHQPPPPMQPHQPEPPVQQSNLAAQQQAPFLQQHQTTANDNKLQVSTPLKRMN